jgi:hypothetical protein
MKDRERFPQLRNWIGKRDKANDRLLETSAEKKIEPTNSLFPLGVGGELVAKWRGKPDQVESKDAKADRPWDLRPLLLPGIALGMGLVTVGSVMSLIAVPPKPNCKGFNFFDGDSSRIYCGNLAVESGQLEKTLEAVNTVAAWSPSHPLYREGRVVLNDWSFALIKQARERLNSGKIDEAIAAISRVPKDIPARTQADKTLNYWQEQAKQFKEIEAKYEAALKDGKWYIAFAQLDIMRRMPSKYWNTIRHEQLSIRLAQEQSNGEKLIEAKYVARGLNWESYRHRHWAVDRRLEQYERADTNPLSVAANAAKEQPQWLVQAIQISEKVDPKSYAAKPAKQEREKWSAALVQHAIKLYKEEKFTEATNILKKIPKDSASYKQAQEWLRLTQAGRAATSAKPVALVDAITQTRAIDPNSPAQTPARDDANRWQQQLQAQTQYSWARALASLPHPAALNLAITTAGQTGTPTDPAVKSDLDRWQQQVQEVQNRETLATARQRASLDSIPSLRQAIAIASQIPSNLPIATEATAARSQWQNRIYVLEDRPILEAARTFARRGDFYNALKTVGKLTPQRPLYNEAQQDVQSWYRHQKIAEDRQVLIAAQNAAIVGQYNRAIDIAKKLKSDRPLYQEAQMAVQTWSANREALVTAAAEEAKRRRLMSP